MRRIFILILVMLGVRCALAQTYGLIQFQLSTAQGQAVSGATINVYTQSACGQPAGVLATLYPKATGGTPLTQPLLTNGLGQNFAYAAQGCVTVVYYSPYTGTLTYPDQNVLAASTVNGGVSSITPLTGIGCTPLVGNSCTGAVTIFLTAGFTINSFTGCGGSLEIGQTVTNPTCSATYSGTPSSANITNTDSIDSPLNLISPFTSGTIVGSFHHTTVTSTTVTLNAIGATAQMATQTYTWNPRIFAGPGTSGATSTVTASGTTAVLSTTDVLPSVQLGTETIGETFGPFTVSGQAIYLLLLGGSHTFVDAETGFPFAFNAPITVTFTNQFGVVVVMYLYQSTNSLTGTFEPKIVS